MFGFCSVSKKFIGMFVSKLKEKTRMFATTRLFVKVDILHQEEVAVMAFLPNSFHLPSQTRLYFTCLRQPGENSHHLK